MKYAYLLLLIPLAACSSSEWKSYRINEHLNVQLPTIPEKVDLPKQGGVPNVGPATLHQMQAFTSSDDYGVYSIVINPADSATLGLLPRDSIYNNRIRQMLLTYQGNLRKRTSFSTPTGNGVEVLLDAVVPNVGKHVLTGVRLLLAGHQSFAFTAVPYAETDTSLATAQRRRFFDSITVKP
jgi:hypothetical protein